MRKPDPRWGDVTDGWRVAWVLELDDGRSLEVCEVYGQSGLTVSLHDERGGMVYERDLRTDDPHVAQRTIEDEARERGWM